MALSRTYPAEWTTIPSADEAIIYSIREKIGDRPEITRYYLTAGSDNSNRYIMSDNSTFNDNGNRFWPYHLSISGLTVTSGVSVLDYKYMNFEGSYGDLKNKNLDFWVESFYLSDFEIWTSFLAVDLAPLLRRPDCLTEQMEILKAAIDLIPALRISKKVRSQSYQHRTVRDNDTEYSTIPLSGVDPYRDMVSNLQNQLNTLLDKCNTRPYWDGIRLE